MLHRISRHSELEGSLRSGCYSDRHAHDETGNPTGKMARNPETPLHGVKTKAVNRVPIGCPASLNVASRHRHGPSSRSPCPHIVYTLPSRCWGKHCRGPLYETGQFPSIPCSKRATCAVQDRSIGREKILKSVGGDREGNHLWQM